MSDSYAYSQQAYVASPQTIIVTTQPGGIQKYPINQREWETGLCSCFEDCGICCCVWWCPCVEMCTISSALEEKWQCCLCWSVCNQYGSSPCLAPIRTKTRVMMGVKGDVCMDWCCAACCPGLVMCQISRQLKAAGMR